MLKLSETEKFAKTVYVGTGTVNDAPTWLPKANFSRTQTDLIAKSSNGEQVVFVDYFTNHELPSIQTENGLLLKGSLLKALAGPLTPGAYAQAAGEGPLSIGEVSNVSGTVKATRLDGTTVDLSNGDPVFQGDTIETTGSGSVGLVFIDKTTLSLSDSGKMVLDELVYDAASGTGSMAVDMLEGAFSFVSGEIAKIGPDAMSVSTPVVTCGIRGTTVAGKAAVEGNDNSFTLLQDNDGQILDAHSISAGLDYPGIGQEHSWLHDIGRVNYVSVQDEEALEAFKLCSRLEGIIPALEPAHALSHVSRIAPGLPDNHILVVNMCGRGDKDVFTVADSLGVVL